MSESCICRVCLAAGVRMLPIAGTPLQAVYEKLVTTELHSAGRPVAACYICCARLHKSYQLMLTAVQAETVLTAMLAECSKVSVRSVSKVDRQAAGLCGALAVSPTAITDTAPALVEIKIEPQTVVKVEFENVESDAGTPERAHMVANDDYDDDDPLARTTTLQQFREIKTEELQTEEGVASGQQSGTRKRAADDSSDEKSATSRNPARTDQKCNVCHKVFDHVSALNVHMRTHTGEKPYECNICHSRFSLKKSLNYHIRNHTGEKLYECNICHSRFPKVNSLTMHIRTHTGEKPHKCTICDSSFCQKSQLKSHLKTHTGEKPYECNDCHRRFAQKIHLEVHTRTHSGEKPYGCKVCKQWFNRKENLIMHSKLHSGVKPHECNICQKRFSLTSYLKKHLKTHQNCPK